MMRAVLPEEERSGLYDPDEEYPWDQDINYPTDRWDDEEEEED
jgi:hypothetical protein